MYNLKNIYIYVENDFGRKRKVEGFELFTAFKTLRDMYKRILKL